MTERTDPPVGASDSHWVSHDPENLPNRDDLIGFGRLVTESRDRMGAAATPEAVLAELQARGVTADLDRVNRCWAKPYR